MTNSIPYLAIVGPTAVGKTALGLQLSNQCGFEIVSVDSRQVYRGMDIGTGKETHLGHWSTIGNTRALVIDDVPIHGLDLTDPDQPYSVSQWHQQILPIINGIRSRGVTPLFVGGTGFYFRALTGSIDSIDIPRNDALRADLSTLSVTALQRQLDSIDSQKYDSLNSSDRNNPARLIRAIEIARYIKNSSQANIPAESQNSTGHALDDSLLTTRYSLQYVGLTMPRELLYAKADRRIEQMFQLGLIQETKQLLQKYSPDLPSMSGIGYREVADLINGEISKSEAIRRIHARNHSYIRRQLTWWRKQNVEWIDVSNRDPFESAMYLLKK